MAHWMLFDSYFQKTVMSKAKLKLELLPYTKVNLHLPMLSKLCNIDKTLLACQSGHSNNRDNKDILEL